LGFKEGNALPGLKWRRISVDASKKHPVYGRPPMALSIQSRILRLVLACSLLPALLLILTFWANEARLGKIIGQ